MTEICTGCPARVCVICRTETSTDGQHCPEDGGLLVALENNALLGKIFAETYQVDEVLGFGSTSMVYQATHLIANRKFALKILHPHLLSDEQSLHRFQLESQAASSLAHPHIITVYESGVSEDGYPYFVMEHLQGTTLEQVLDEQGPMPVRRAMRLFVQIALGLSHAHEHGVLHRDLKPSNIFLLSDENNGEQAKLLDFGVAKLLASSDGNNPQLSFAGEVCGTPTILSPEQCHGKPLDFRSDLYSLGCLMYETLSGIPPFLGDSVIETMQKHVNEKAAEFDDVVPELHIPWSIATIIFRCLEKEPNDRYQSANEVRRMLESISLSN